MARVLVVDDERSMRELLEIVLGKAGHQVELAEDAPSALTAFAAGRHDLVLTDLMLGRGSGLDVLQGVKKVRPGTEVIVLTAYSTTEGAIQAMRLGAYDYAAKPFKVDELTLLVQKALEKTALLEDNELLRAELSGRAQMGRLVGKSPGMKRVFELVQRVAGSRKSVLVTGESGVGKELVARAVHEASPRASGPFVALNCGAIPEGLIESELFGHERGAFTGATGRKEGRFERANEGTLFLDEVGELSALMQVKLLRVLQEGEIERLGGTAPIKVDSRVVAATNRDLAAEVKAGRFREDLFYRLNVLPIPVPPLRERREDILPLAEHFLRKVAAEANRPGLTFSAEARRRLDEYSFPGNVRELENLVERAAMLSDGTEVSPDALPVPLRSPRPPPPSPEGDLPAGFNLEQHLEGIERSLYERSLQQAHGIKKDAAALLGLTFRQFRHRWKKLGNEPASPDTEVDDEPGEPRPTPQSGTPPVGSPGVGS